MKKAIVCLLAVLLTGAGAYKRLLENGEDAFFNRTAPQYIATKVRQADMTGAIRVACFGDVEALELREEIGGTVYVTRIYSYDGYIRELFSDSSVEFFPSDGEKIVETGKVGFTLEGGCLTVTLFDKEGNETKLRLALRSKEAAE